MPPITHESTVSWLLIQVPLAGHRGEVAIVLHDLRDRQRLIHFCIACLKRVFASQQTDSRRMAFRGVVELAHPQSVTSERVHVGRFNFAAVTTKIREPQIIDHHQDNVGPLVGRDHCRGGKQQQ